jgi:hypothetical protein
MTEARILWDYVFKTYFPSSHGLNIYNDGFPVSKSLLMPISTLLAIIGWGLVFVLAIIKRKQWPFFTFGALWFLGGHLLESTFLGLELYFEHRNYLPSFGLVLMVVGSIFHQIELFLLKHNKSYIDSVRQSPLVQMGVILLFFWLIWSALVLGREANSWSSARLMAAASLEDRPDSLRANQDAAAYYANVSDYRSSALVLHHIEQKWPGYAGTTAHKMLINCFDANVLLPPADESLARFRNGPMDRGAVPTLHEILRLKRSGSCQHFSWEDYRKFLVALQENSSFSSQKENVLILLAYSYNAQSLFKEAAEVLASGNLSKPSIGYMFLSAQFMAMAGNIGSAREITQQIRINYPVNSKPWILHSDKVELLEQQLDLSIE